MLTNDMVRVKIDGLNIAVRPLTPRTKKQALEIVKAYDDVFANGLGQNRKTIRERIAEVEVPAQQNRLAAGLQKLIEDRAVFEEGRDPIFLKRRISLFKAAQAWRDNHEGALDRARIFGLVEAEEKVEPGVLEEKLYGDLREEQVLLEYLSAPACVHVERYIHAQYEALLLRAREVRIKLIQLSPEKARIFFRKLAFHRLLFRIRHEPSGDYQITISGPHALFRSTTKYGLQLALAFRALVGMQSFSMEADVDWGAAKRRYLLRCEPSDLPATRASSDAPVMSDARLDIISRLERARSPWRVRVANAVFHVGGQELCIPDIELSKSTNPHKVFVEVMGHWSREAVFRRLDQLKEFTEAHVILAVSDKLRVSEALAEDLTHGHLYRYKGVMSAKCLLSLADALVD